jgi:cytoskeletal protein CcmA (bactofilin family)
MSKKSLFLGSLGFVIVFMLGFFNTGHAQQFRHGNNANIAAGEKINSAAYLAGQSVDVAGDVNGDLFCAGQNINISGTVHGDVICAGQNINISGKVDGDIRIAGQSVDVSASADNLTVFTQNFTLSGKGNIARDITGAAKIMTINGTVGRDITLGATNATINGTVGRNITSGVEHLTLGSSAKVNGNISYTSHNQLSKESGAQVTGTVKRTEPPEEKNKSGWFGIGFRIYWFFAALLVALALILLFPAIFQRSATRALDAPGKTILLGVATVLFTPIVFVILLITIVGIPLGLLLLFAWIMALVLSGSFFAYLIGRLIWKAQRNSIWIMLVGAVILLLVYNIPYLGGLVMFAALFFGTGMVVRELTQRTPRPVYKIK